MLVFENCLCRDPGSNRGPSDLQSDALPTELSRLVDGPNKLASNRIAYETSKPWFAQPKRQGWPWGEFQAMAAILDDHSLAMSKQRRIISMTTAAVHVVCRLRRGDAQFGYAPEMTRRHDSLAERSKALA